ncbi:MAG TPA: PEPxxWA-CTERM sorting domain-containing protein [Sphingomonas sp.]|nr:PEPxxWA-CTERM sorting domain-containing protein [Sphingomonas sp.]
MLRFALMACAAVTAFGAPARAITYSTAGAVAAGDPGIGAAETLVAGFDGGDSLSLDPGHSSGYGFFTGSHSGVAAAPAGDSSQYVAIGTGGHVLFDLRDFGGADGHIDSVSVYLGSLDPYNFIDLFGLDADGNLDFSHSLLTISGSDMSPGSGDWYSAQTNRRVTMNFDAADHVGGLMFRSTGVAFEFDSIAIGAGHIDAGPDQSGAVPEPASWAMLVGGFGLIGGAMRSRCTGLALARS